MLDFPFTRARRAATLCNTITSTLSNTHCPASKKNVKIAMSRLIIQQVIICSQKKHWCHLLKTCLKRKMLVVILLKNTQMNFQFLTLKLCFEVDEQRQSRMNGGRRCGTMGFHLLSVGKESPYLQSIISCSVSLFRAIKMFILKTCSEAVKLFIQH